VRTLILALIALHVSSRGGKHGFVYASRHRAYRALRRQGKSKEVAARIANAGRSFGGRSRMARKGARKRRKR
jgi:hypothetical protein